MKWHLRRPGKSGQDVACGKGKDTLFGVISKPLDRFMTETSENTRCRRCAKIAAKQLVKES